MFLVPQIQKMFILSPSAQIKLSIFYNLTFGNHEAWTKEVTSKLPVRIASSTVQSNLPCAVHNDIY